MFVVGSLTDFPAGSRLRRCTNATPHSRNGHVPYAKPFTKWVHSGYREPFQPLSSGLWRVFAGSLTLERGAVWYNDERALLPPIRFVGRAVGKPLTTLHAHQSCGAVEVGNAVERETTAASPWLCRHAPFPLVPIKGNGRGEVHIRMQQLSGYTERIVTPRCLHFMASSNRTDREPGCVMLSVEPIERLMVTQTQQAELARRITNISTIPNPPPGWRLSATRVHAKR